MRAFSRIRRRGSNRPSVRCAAFLRPALLLCSALLLAAPALASLKIDASLDPETAGPGERVVLTVNVEGAINLDSGPQIPPVEGVTVRSAGQSTNLSIVNGKMSRSVVFQFVVSAEKPGQYALGPIEVRDGGKLYHTAMLTLNIVPRQGGSARPPTSPVPGGRAPAAPASDAEESEGLFVRSEVDRDHVVLGEQVTLRFRFYQRPGVPLLEQPQYNAPSTEGFWREDLPPQRTSTQVVRGHSYQVTELVYALFPTQSGRLTIGEGTLDCVVRDRRRVDPFSLFGSAFGGRDLRLRSRPIAVRVDPLPEPKPADFTGGVGSYSFNATLDRTEVAQNEPVTLSLTVKGAGNVATVGDPLLPELVGFRSYPSGSEVKNEQGGDVLKGAKTFSVVLVPESAGPKELPEFTLSVYDPVKRAYTRLRSRPPGIQVQPARPGAASGEGGEVTRLGRDLRDIRAAAHLRPAAASRPWKRPGFWVLQALPLLLLGAAVGLRSWRGHREANWGLVLSRGSAGRLRREVAALRGQQDLSAAEGFGRLDAILERFLTDRFHLPVRGLTREELLQKLRQARVGQEGLDEVHNLLEKCDFARFAPASQTSEELSRALSRALALPGVLEKKREGGAKARTGAPTSSLLALLCLAAAAASSGALPLPAAAAPVLSAEEAASAVRRGNEAYARGDYLGAAREYGAALAGGYESADLLLNLGNASYRLGRLGWAVYYYERGRGLAPRDPDLKANLDLALQETKDKVPEVDSSRFLSWLVRLQDRTSLAGALRWVSAFWWLAMVWFALKIALSGPSRGHGPRWLRGRGAGAVGAVLTILLAGSISWAGMKILQTANGPSAVVVAEELPVRSNPDGEATTEFTLHAGTRVRLGRSEGEFREVLFSEKLRGWGAEQGLARLAAPGEAALAPADVESVLGGLPAR